MGTMGRFLCVALLALVGCSAPSEAKFPSGSADPVVIADVQAIVGSLHDDVAEIAAAVEGKDRGVDSRLRRCLNSLEVARVAVNNAPALKEREVLSLLEPFARNYESLVQELETEGMRGPAGELQGAEGLEVPLAPAMLVQIRARVAAAVAK